MIENEDLQDRINLMSDNQGTIIDYMPYIQTKNLEKTIQAIQSPE
mgnify:CR=1 FL=1